MHSGTILSPMYADIKNREFHHDADGLEAQDLFNGKGE